MNNRKGCLQENNGSMGMLAFVLFEIVNDTSVLQMAVDSAYLEACMVL